MIVRDLIEELKTFNEEWEVCFLDSERAEQVVKSVEQTETISPSGIPFIVLKGERLKKVKNNDKQNK